jgi:hypothetical protein
MIALVLVALATLGLWIALIWILFLTLLDLKNWSRKC